MSAVLRMGDFDTAAIRDALQRLRTAAPDVFGANGHHFALNAPLLETQIRRFLIELGNGGAGPYYGVHPLGTFDGVSDDVRPWDDFVGSLAEPFAFREPWNDLVDCPDHAPADTDEEEYERRMNAFERRYWHPSVMNGAFPICHKGCALRIWLVVSGGEAGNVWCDDRADYGGIAPVLTHGGGRASFGAWYTEWLDEALRAIHS